MGDALKCYVPESVFRFLFRHIQGLIEREGTCDIQDGEEENHARLLESGYADRRDNTSLTCFKISPFCNGPFTL
jgi:hypothetical protein